MTTISTRNKPSIFVAFPRTAGAGPGFSTIRNTAAAVAAYVAAVAPAVAAVAADVIARRPDLAARTWYAALLVVAGKVSVDTRRSMFRQTAGRHSTTETVAMVRSQFEERDYEIYTSTRDHLYPLHCTCPDADERTGSAPRTAGAIRACKHVIAYVLVRALAEAAQAA